MLFNYVPLRTRRDYCCTKYMVINKHSSGSQQNIAEQRKRPSASQQNRAEQRKPPSSFSTEHS